MALYHGDAVKWRDAVFDYIKRVKLVEPTSEINPTKVPYVYAETTATILLACDTIYAARSAKTSNRDAKVAILNFASYKSPGGGFMTDKYAQEEAICYCTNLYPELEKHRNWYYAHTNNLNKGLYRDECILSHNISIIANERGVMREPDDVLTIDVLTCAAPNWSPALRYNTVPEEELEKVTRQRARYVVRTLSQDKYDTIILGAFGCGVFKNDPTVVAQAFKDAIAEHNGCFKTVIFAIPDYKSQNFQAFLRVLNK